jgi:C-terminal processing protease CtpA/Prc
MIESAEAEKIITGSTEMSFIDLLWGIEVTGGIDQNKPLTILAIKRNGLAKRAGMRIFDKIIRINDIEADTLTLQEAQTLINESGRYVRIAVCG